MIPNAAITHHAPTRLPDRFWRIPLGIAIVAAWVAVAANGTQTMMLNANVPMILVWTFFIFGLIECLYFLLSVFWALRYKPTDSVAFDRAPSLTVIVPAYNEGPMVRIAIESVLACRYPASQLEIIAIDDGSQDDTWVHMSRLDSENPGRITLVQQPFNQGKREALRLGIERAKGEFVITVDSDSTIDREALLSIVAPLVKDSEVGAVAGNVGVLNRKTNLWTRLMGAQFFITFDLKRAAQSCFGAVLCTPGAFSAYRKSALMTILQPWASQTFLGTPCTIGEDRALATWLLRTGWRSVYQRTGRAHTIVPSDIPKISRMLIRWERGNIREDFVMLPMLLTRWRKRDRWWPTIEVVLNLAQHPISVGILSIVFAYLALNPAGLASAIALFLLTAAAHYLYCLRSEETTDFFYGVMFAVVAFVGLQWVFPYSLLTVRNGRWLTR